MYDCGGRVVPYRAGGERRRVFRVRIFTGGRFVDIPGCLLAARVGRHAHGVGKVSDNDAIVTYPPKQILRIVLQKTC